jgi:hypothetical protein
VFWVVGVKPWPWIELIFATSQLVQVCERLWEVDSSNPLPWFKVTTILNSRVSLSTKHGARSWRTTHLEDSVDGSEFGENSSSQSRTKKNSILVLEQFRAQFFFWLLEAIFRAFSAQIFDCLTI